MVKMKKKKLDNSTKILLVVFILGLSLLLYPIVSNYWNSFHQSRVVAEYTDYVASLDSEDYAEIFNAAQEYNADLANSIITKPLNGAHKKEYEKTLNVLGSGVMGYIEIPSIRVDLPIYHGTADEILQVAVGHIDWSSLPVGGKSTHCVLSGHRGLPNATLFSHLDRLEEGDIFMLHILDETFSYEVDRILIVEPGDTAELEIVSGQDYCTLLTCTPYGINTHRLLVRGHRIDNAATFNTRITSEALKVEPLIVAPIILVPILVLLIILLILADKSIQKHHIEEDDIVEK